MGLSNEELLKTIRYYQESLDKYTSNKNDHKLLSTIERLKKLPIATAHLEDTGIGRTVNALRKLGGDVGDAAKCLVAKWKDMVVQEEEKAKEETPDDSANTTYSSENEIDNYEERDDSSGERRSKEKESNSSHKSSVTEKRSSEKLKKESDKHSSSSDKKVSSHDKKDRKKDRDSSSKHRRQEQESSSEEHRSKRKRDISDSESDEELYETKHSKSKSKRIHKSESSEDEEESKYKSKKSKHSKDCSDSDTNDRKHKSKSSKSSRSDESSSKLKEKTEIKASHYDSSSDVEDKTNFKHDYQSKRNLDCEESKINSKQSHKSHEANSDTEEGKSKHRHESKSKHDSSKSKSHSSRSEKHEKKDKKDSKRDETKEKHSHKSESRKSDEKHKKRDEKENSKKEKSSTSKLEENDKSESKPKSDKKIKEKAKTTPVNKEKIVNGIDSGSGASFAEALGMCGPLVSSKSSTSSSSGSKRKTSSLPSSEKPKSTSSTSYAKLEKAEFVEEEYVPSLLKEQPPEPLNINISNLLPEITPHYRPLGFPIDSQPKRMLTPDEALSQAISNKNIRTKVYSGNKSHGKVDSLFDLCVRILQDNLDALEYTGGVPYSILKCVLDKATPDQLFNMEHHNPYLIEDTDELWQLHCQKEFRNKKREELESWREMYMRCLDEREARLNAITANIKIAQDKSAPVRTTKLAYMDSVVKPPRNIARKQAKNGIVIVKPTQTPSSRLSALATAGEAGKIVVPNPGSRAVDRSSSSSAAPSKPKKAPLMAKTLLLLKNRFRR